VTDDLNPEARIFWVTELAHTELYNALQRFPIFNSPHEGYAVILEEIDELWEHVKANDGETQKAMDEAVQVAAMALRFVYDLADWGPQA
jgi:hypothetical protein